MYHGTFKHCLLRLGAPTKMRVWVAEQKCTPIMFWEDCDRPDWMLWLLMRTSRNYVKYRKRIARKILDIYVDAIIPFANANLSSTRVHGFVLLKRLIAGREVKLSSIVRERGKAIRGPICPQYLHAQRLMLQGIERVVRLPGSMLSWLMIAYSLEHLIDYVIKRESCEEALCEHVEDIKKNFRRPSDFAIKRAAGV